MKWSAFLRMDGIGRLLALRFDVLAIGFTICVLSACSAPTAAALQEWAGPTRVLYSIIEMPEGVWLSMQASSGVVTRERLEGMSYYPLSESDQREWSLSIQSESHPVPTLLGFWVLPRGAFALTGNPQLLLVVESGEGQNIWMAGKQKTSSKAVSLCKKNLIFRTDGRIQHDLRECFENAAMLRRFERLVRSKPEGESALHYRDGRFSE